MKNWGIILVFSFLLIACNPPQQSARMDLLDDGALKQFPWDDVKSIQANLIPEAQSILPEMGSAPYYLLDFELDPLLESVKGIVVVRYTNTSEDTLPYLVFQLFPVVYGGIVTLGEITVNQQLHVLRTHRARWRAQAAVRKRGPGTTARPRRAGRAFG